MCGCRYMCTVFNAGCVFEGFLGKCLTEAVSGVKLYPVLRLVYTNLCVLGNELALANCEREEMA